MWNCTEKEELQRCVRTKPGIFRTDYDYSCSTAVCPEWHLLNDLQAKRNLTVKYNLRLFEIVFQAQAHYLSGTKEGAI
jgi:hypothetical protein